MSYKEIFEKQYFTFLDKLYNKTDYVGILLIDHNDSSKTLHEFCYVNKLYKEEYIKYLRYMNAKDNRSIYITVNRMKELAKKRIIENMETEVDRIWLDIDSDFYLGQTILKRIREFLGEPSMVILTSKQKRKIKVYQLNKYTQERELVEKEVINKNYQVYYMLDRFYDYNEVAEVLRKIEYKFKIDKTHDITRVFRIPGFVNRKPGKDCFCSIQQVSDKKYSLEHFQNLVRDVEIPHTDAKATDIQKEKIEATKEILDIIKKEEFGGIYVTVEGLDRLRGRVRTQSERDIHFAIYTIANASTKDQELLKKALIFYLANKRQKKRDSWDYATRTVRKAAQYVQEQREKFEKSYRKKSIAEKLRQLDQEIEAEMGYMNITSV